MVCFSSGWCTWTPRIIINAACSPDVTFYPFDEQQCPLTVTTWSLDASKVTFTALTDAWDTADLDKSGIWAVHTTKSAAYTAGGSPYIDFTITIKRKPLFLAIVIVLPILLLSLLTGFLFLLPPGSGERTGFGITCFLSFVVILQVIMQFLPESSVPMSILCYYIITMLLFSAGLSIVNILILRMYLSPSSDKIPAWLIGLVKIARCIPCRLLYRRCKCREKLNACCRRCCDRVIVPACQYCREAMCTCWEKYGRCRCRCHRLPSTGKYDVVSNSKFNNFKLPSIFITNKVDSLKSTAVGIHIDTTFGARSKLNGLGLPIKPLSGMEELNEDSLGRPRRSDDNNLIAVTTGTAVDGENHRQSRIKPAPTEQCIDQNLPLTAKQKSDATMLGSSPDGDNGNQNVEEVSMATPVQSEADCEGGMSPPGLLTVTEAAAENSVPLSTQVMNEKQIVQVCIESSPGVADSGKLSSPRGLFEVTGDRLEKSVAEPEGVKGKVTVPNPVVTSNDEIDISGEAKTEERNNSSEDDDPDEKVITDDEEEVDDVENTPAFIAGLTWELIAQILDVFFIVVFISVQITFSVLFIVPLGARY